jgi:hypothetical protein
MRYYLAFALLTLLAAFERPQAQASSITLSGCGDRQNDLAARLSPYGPGPLRLSKIYCVQALMSGFSGSPPMPSPNGGAFFVFSDRSGLQVGDLFDERKINHFGGKVTALLPFLTDLPFGWSQSSQSVLGVRQDTITPGGFSRGPLRTYLFFRSGAEQALPDLTHPNGPLDQIFWVGRAGMALAAFGTKGRYYRPEHVDTQPTLAIIDARSGRVLQAVAIGGIDGVRKDAIVSRVASRFDEHGRLHAVISLTPSKLLEWIQGEKPKLIPIDVSQSGPLALAPDGRSVLVMQNLSASGMICEHNPQCPPPVPSTGAIVDLRDLRSGRLIWSLRGTAKTFATIRQPAISRDGRLALISIPELVAGSPITALVSMKTGKVLQEFPSPWSGECAMGFLDDSKAAWISGGAYIVVYNIGPKWAYSPTKRRFSHSFSNNRGRSLKAQMSYIAGK